MANTATTTHCSPCLAAPTALRTHPGPRFGVGIHTISHPARSPPHHHPCKLGRSPTPTGSRWVLRSWLHCAGRDAQSQASLSSLTAYLRPRNASLPLRPGPFQALSELMLHSSVHPCTDLVTVPNRAKCAHVCLSGLVRLRGCQKPPAGPTMSFQMVDTRPSAAQGREAGLLGEAGRAPRGGPGSREGCWGRTPDRTSPTGLRWHARTPHLMRWERAPRGTRACHRGSDREGRWPPAQPVWQTSSCSGHQVPWSEALCHGYGENSDRHWSHLKLAPKG